MVNFNSETTTGTPAVDIERVVISERRYHLIEAYEEYKRKKYCGSAIPVHIIRARFFGLFLELQAFLLRCLKEVDYKKIENIALMSDEVSEKEIYDAVKQINIELDRVKLIRIDNQKVYDATDVEAENKEKGY